MGTITLDNFDEIIESWLMNKRGAVTLVLTKDSARDLIEWMEMLLDDEGQS
jgi:hypothetical protein